MKKLLFAILALSVVGLFTSSANAQMMRGFRASDVNWNEVVEHTLREEQEGQAIWEKLQAEQIQCTDISEEDSGALGEYFMGQMMGDSHAAMNAMMIQMLGEEGEEQMHIVMGKRLSGCDTSAAIGTTWGGFMPMMQMMWGGWSTPFGLPNTNMMNWGYGTFGAFGWIFMLLWWVLIVVLVVFAVRWLVNQFRSREHDKSPVEILKERYARGEIDKKEYEEKKKDLV